MNKTKLFLTFWSLQGIVLINSEKPYCAHQIESIRIVEGGSVTIPCSFSYPREEWDNKSEIRVYWRSGRTSPCGSTQNAYIYNHTEKWTHPSYRGRLSMVGNPKELRSASIRIQPLKNTDGPLFCCRVVINKTDGFKEKQERWQNRHGTYLRFPGDRWVDQLDVVPAFPEENVTIPCSVPHLRGIENIIESVTWRRGQSDLCRDHTRLSWDKASRQRLSIKNFPKDLSVIIQDVRSSDRGLYCCEVTTERNQYSSVHGTELAVRDSVAPPKFTVTQPLVSSAWLGDSVTISCSFTISDGTDPLWTGVYWRVSSPTGDYAYHPSREMIHPTYRGRTDLTGQTDLHIKNVQGTDYTTYYCLVILRECVGLNTVDANIVHGRGTSLSMTVTISGTEDTSQDPADDPSSPRQANPREEERQPEDYTPVIIAVVVGILAILIICGILIILKMKGLICSKTENEDDVKSQSSNTPSRSQANPTNEPTYESVTDMQTEQAQEPGGGIVYAELNMNSLNNESIKRTGTDQTPGEAQVVYAAVKPAKMSSIYPQWKNQ